MSDMALYGSAAAPHRPVARGVRNTTTALLIGAPEPEVRRLADYLAGQDVLVHEAEDDEWEHAARVADRFDVVIAVASLPNPDVSDFIRKVSADEGAPILVMSETGEFVERVLALELGADDLIGRDTNPREVLARLRGLVRRSRRMVSGQVAGETGASGQDDGSWMLDSVGRVLVSPSGERLSLSRADAELMSAFFDNDQRTISENHAPPAKLRTAVSRMKRRALEQADMDLPIRNVRGWGYRFEAPAVSVS